MGAVRLAELCGQLEKSANSLSSLDISELIAKIDGEFAFV
jgi:hypothetical protein